MRKLSSLVAKFALLFLLVFTGAGAADTVPLGDTGYFIAGIRTEEFVQFAAPESSGRQRMANWCWAACIQMVLNYHGLYVDQQDIVERVFGSAVDRPANGQQIMGALSGWAPDTRGRRSSIYADAYHLDAETVINDLDKKWPLIVGLSGARGQRPRRGFGGLAPKSESAPSGAPMDHGLSRRRGRV